VWKRSSCRGPIVRNWRRCFRLCERGGAEHVFENDGVARLRNGEIRLGGNESCQEVCMSEMALDFAAPFLEDDFAEIDGAASRRNSPENVR